jgi:uncharacterized RDD family membrane protein YckC
MSDTNYATAPLSRRLAAMIYDGLILIALYIMAGFAVVAVIKATNNNQFPGELPAAVNLSLMFIIAFFYYSDSWRRRNGQTVGMKAWGLKLVNDNGGRLQLSQCMLRVGTGFFSLAIFGLGFLWALIDKKQRSWHDIASVSHQVFIPKEMRQKS